MRCANSKGTKTKHSSPNCPIHSSASPAEPHLLWLWGTHITAPTPSVTSSPSCRSYLHDFTPTYIQPPPATPDAALQQQQQIHAGQPSPPKGARHLCHESTELNKASSIPSETPQDPITQVAFQLCRGETQNGAGLLVRAGKPSTLLTDCTTSAPSPPPGLPYGGSQQQRQPRA